MRSFTPPYPVSDFCWSPCWSSSPVVQPRDLGHACRRFIMSAFATFSPRIRSISTYGKMAMAVLSSLVYAMFVSVLCFSGDSDAIFRHLKTSCVAPNGSKLPETSIIQAVCGRLGRFPPCLESRQFILRVYMDDFDIPSASRPTYSFPQVPISSVDGVMQLLQEGNLRRTQVGRTSFSLLPCLYLIM